MSGADGLAEIERRMRVEMPAWLEELADLGRLALAAGTVEWDEHCHRVGHLAHRIRGRAGMLGLGPLAEAAARLEATAKGTPSPSVLSSGVGQCVGALPDASR